MFFNLNLPDSCSRSNDLPGLTYFAWNPPECFDLFYLVSIWRDVLWVKSVWLNLYCNLVGIWFYVFWVDSTWINLLVRNLRDLIYFNCNLTDTLFFMKPTYLTWNLSMSIYFFTNCNCLTRNLPDSILFFMKSAGLVLFWFI